LLLARELRLELDDSIPKLPAARALGVSVKSLDRWIATGDIPSLRRPGSSRSQIETDSVLDLLDEVTRLREEGVVSGVIAHGLARLREAGRLRPKLRPNAGPLTLGGGIGRRRRLNGSGSQPSSATCRRDSAQPADSPALRTSRAEAAMSHPDLPLRFFELLRVLRTHGVDFILIGGFSLAFHGHAAPTTSTSYTGPSPRNIERLWSALVELRARPRGLEDFRREELRPFDLDSLLRGGSWLLDTDLGSLDVQQTIANVPLGDEPWRLLREQALEVELEEIGAPILVAGRDDLILLKRAAGRPQDLVDIESLRLAEGRDA
jgi:hypothetical protein